MPAARSNSARRGDADARTMRPLQGVRRRHGQTSYVAAFPVRIHNRDSGSDDCSSRAGRDRSQGAAYGREGRVRMADGRRAGGRRGHRCRARAAHPSGLRQGSRVAAGAGTLRCHDSSSASTTCSAPASSAISTSLLRLRRTAAGGTSTRDGAWAGAGSEKFAVGRWIKYRPPPSLIATRRNSPPLQLLDGCLPQW